MTIATPFDLAPAITGGLPADQGAVAAHWIRLTKDLPPVPEAITRVQLAQAIDELMGTTNHCTGAKAADAYNAQSGQTTEQYAQKKLAGEGCQSFASKLNISRNCALDKVLGKPLIKRVYAHCSSEAVREDYTLRSLGSAIVLSGPSPSSRIIQVEIEFGKTSYVPVRYYAEAEDVAELWAKPEYSPQWIGPVLQGITRIDPPSPRWSAATGTVLLNKTVSGKLVIYLPIQFDTWTVSIPGRMVGNKRNYTARFAASSALLDGPAQITLEDETDADPLANDCSICGSHLADQIDSGLIGGVVIPDDDDPEEYYCPEDKVIGCCDGEPIDPYVPRCESVFTGFSSLPEEVVEYYKQKYGDDTQFIGVGPTDPPCGKQIVTRSSDDCDNCPAGLVSILEDQVPEEIAAGGSVVVVWEGGVPPFSCAVSGQGFYFAGGGTELETSDYSVTIYASSESCGTCNFDLASSSNCGKDKISLRSSNCIWNIIEDTLQDSIGHITCTSREYRYTDDWCSPGSCTGSGTNYCGPPPDPDWTDIEGNKIERCDCP